MPRTKFPKLRRHVSGQAVVTLNGRDYYCGRWGNRTAREAYESLLAKWLANGRTLQQADERITVVELLVAFKRSGKIRESQADAYHAAIKLLDQHFGHVPATNFGPVALDELRQIMIAAGWKRRTINARVYCVRRIFRWAVSREMVDANVVVALSTIEGLRAGESRAPESEPIKPVAVDHFNATLPHLPPMLQAMIQLHRLTGMRAGELCDLRTCDIDTRGDVWIYRPPRHKIAHRGHTREIAIGPRARELLKPYLGTDLQAFIFSPAIAERERRDAEHAARKTPASCGNTPGSNRKRRPAKSPGNRYTTATYRQAIEYATDRAFPLPAELQRATGERVPAWRRRMGSRWADVLKWRRLHRWTPLQVRHAFAQDTRDKFGLEHEQRALGHRHARVSEIYAGVALEKAIEVAAAIG